MKKKYVVIEQKKFERLQKLAAKKVPAQKKLSLEEGRKYAHKLIDEWASDYNMRFCSGKNAL